MSSLKTCSALDEFAAQFVANINRHSEVRSEQLAEALRARFDLPPFPRIGEVRHLCVQLGIPLWSLPETIPEVLGINISYGDDVNIAMQPRLRQSRTESTLVHEIREALENAFQRVKPAYEGLPTHDNLTMNQRSDRFGGYLLMETDASRNLLRDVGFDFMEFARRTGRPLSAVLLRAQKLFPARSAVPGPVLATWLFEAPWALVEAGRSQPTDLTVRHVAKLSGFSQRKGTLAARVFPSRSADAASFEITTRALEERRACSAFIQGMGLADDMNYLALAEPAFARGVPWRLLLTAVRLDALPVVRPLLARLDARLAEDQLQRV